MEAKIKMKQIDAALLQKMLIGGAKRLEANKEYINELNVPTFESAASRPYQ